MTFYGRRRVLPGSRSSGNSQVCRSKARPPWPWGRTTSAPQTVDVLIAAAAAGTSPLSAINLHHFHGAAARVPLPASAFGVRQPHFMTEIIACWGPATGQDADGAVPHRQWAD